MELSTYLSFPLVMVASSALLYGILTVVTSVVSNCSHSDYLNLPLTDEQALAALLKNNIARVIYVILANKYGTTYLPQLLPSNGGSLGFNI